MSSFEERLKNAIERGQRKSDSRARAEEIRRMNEEELRRLHGQYRLQLCDQIEKCLSRLPDHFPGFRFETTVTEQGWGAVVSRDDIRVDRQRRRNNLFSRLQILVRPYSEYHVLNVTAKGTIRNRELLNRDHFEKLVDVDIDQFIDLVDRWTLEFAELYAAHD